MPVDTQHPSYTDAAPIWERCRDFDAGEDAVKARCRRWNSLRDITSIASLTYREPYLPRIGEQTDAEYATYLARAQVYGAVGRTIDGLVGAVFRAEPEISLPAGLTALADDADGRGTPLSVLAKVALREVLTVGRVGILVSMPEGEQVGATPYLALYRAEDVTNWLDGSMVQMVTLRECVTEPDSRDPFIVRELPRFRVLSLESGLWVVRIHQRPIDSAGKSSSSTWEVLDLPQPTSRQRPFPFIPFTCIGPNSLGLAMQKPPALDLVNTMLHHFRSSAELENINFIASMPQPVIIGDMRQQESATPEYRIGTPYAWTLPGGASVEMLEAGGAGADRIAASMAADERRAALLGARLLEPQKREAETAEAMRLRQAGESATLASVAANVSWGLTQALGWAAEWVGADADGAFITLNQEFADASMTEADANLIADRRDKGLATLEDAYYLLRRGGRIEPEVTYEQWRRKLEEQAPLPLPLPEFPPTTIA